MDGTPKLSIYISGAHSVGKTTLQEALMKNREFSQYHFKRQMEIARVWIPNKGYTQEMMLDPAILLRLEYELLYAQLQSEATEMADYADNASRFLWDRGILDPLVYTKVFCEEGALDDMLLIPEVQTALSRLKRSEDVLVFIPKPQKEFISSDGLRRDSDMMELLSLHDAMVQTLNEFSIPHTVIERANLSERVNVVLDTVKRKWPFLITQRAVPVRQS